MKKFLCLLIAASMLAPYAGTGMSASASEIMSSNQSEHILSYRLDLDTLDATAKELKINSSGQTIASGTFVSSYRDELTEEQQKIYDNLKSYYLSDTGLSNGVTSDFSYKCQKEVIDGDIDTPAYEIMDDISFAYCAFVNDYPTMFWAGGFEINLFYSSTGGAYTFTTELTLEEEYEGAKSAIDEYNKGVEEIATEIYNSVASDFTAYNCYKAIHEYLCNNATYNHDAVNYPETYAYAYSSGAIFTSLDNSVTCEGYAESFKVLCDQIQRMYLSDKQNVDSLQCILVHGIAYANSSNGENHLWNYVKMPDGKWYAVDATWDDQEALGTQYNYFLCGSGSKGFYERSFSEDHVERSSFASDGSVNFTYPTIAEKAYSPANDIGVDLTNISDTENDSSIALEGKNVSVTAKEGDEVTVYVKAENAEKALGIWQVINYDGSALKYNGVNNSVGQVMVNPNVENRITLTSMFEATGTDFINETNIFELSFTALKDISSSNSVMAYTVEEFYDWVYNDYDVDSTLEVVAVTGASDSDTDTSTDSNTDIDTDTPINSDTDIDTDSDTETDIDINLEGKKVSVTAKKGDEIAVYVKAENAEKALGIWQVINYDGGALKYNGVNNSVGQVVVNPNVENRITLTSMFEATGTDFINETNIFVLSFTALRDISSSDSVMAYTVEEFYDWVYNDYDVDLTLKVTAFIVPDDFDTDTDTSTDISTDSDTDISTDISTDSDTDISTDISTDSDTDISTDISTDSDTDISTDISTDSDTDTSTDINTDPDADISTDISTDSDTDISTDINTDSDTDTSTDISTDSDTDITSDTDTEIDIDPSTDSDIDSDITPVFEYTVLDDGTVSITSYNGDGGDVVIPSEIDGKAVTAIADGAFAECTTITSVVIPDSVTTIEKNAFIYCENLTNVTIPDNVIYIGSDAFTGTPFISTFDGEFVILSNILYKYNGNNKKVTIPDGVASISDYAFLTCEDLTEVTIPKSVTYIGEYAFEICDDLVNINYCGTEEEWNSIVKANNNSPLTSANITFNYSEPVEPIGIYGDMTGDGRVTSADALCILRIMAGYEKLTDDIKLIADVNCDGMVNSIDVFEILRFNANYSTISKVNEPIYPTE